MNDLRDTELWDDTSLIDTWDNALVEYKKYHSIRARSRTKNSASEPPGSSENTLRVPNVSSSNERTQEEDETGNIPDGSGNLPDLELPIKHNDEIVVDAQPNVEENGIENIAETRTAAPDTMLPPSSFTEDEALRNVMISWYYAGYYTAIYERSQQQKQQQQQQNN